MPHATGSVVIGAYQTGADFAPDVADSGIDTRGGFFLTADARNTQVEYRKIDLLQMFGNVSGVKISFDYSDISSGAETKAGWYYGVINIQKV